MSSCESSWGNAHLYRISACAAHVCNRRTWRCLESFISRLLVGALYSTLVKTWVGGWMSFVRRAVVVKEKVVWSLGEAQTVAKICTSRSFHQSFTTVKARIIQKIHKVLWVLSTSFRNESWVMLRLLGLRRYLSTFEGRSGEFRVSRHNIT